MTASIMKSGISLTLMFGLGLNAVSVCQAVEAELHSTQFFSEPLILDKKYPAMTGPVSDQTVFLKKGEEPELLWVKAWRIRVVDDSDGKALSSEFLCHSFIEDAKKRDWPLRQHSSHDHGGGPHAEIMGFVQGITDVKLPEGFGIPIMSDKELSFNVQALNNNIENQVLRLRFKAEVDFYRDQDLASPIRPLKTFIVAVTDSKDKKVPWMWPVEPGRQTFRADVTHQLNLASDVTVHAITSHLHETAESVELRDLTAGKTLFKGRVLNFEDRLGIQHIETFSSEKGIVLLKDHDYELVSVYNNTTGETREGMAILRLYYAVNETGERQ